MATIVLSSLATMMVQVPIEARLNGNPNYNPTNDVVKLAFMPGIIKPATPDWNTGSWATDPGPEYLAQCLVGPTGTITVPIGTYNIWVTVFDSPETVVLQTRSQLIIE